MLESCIHYLYNCIGTSVLELLLTCITHRHQYCVHLCIVAVEWDIMYNNEMQVLCCGVCLFYVVLYDNEHGKRVLHLFKFLLEIVDIIL